MRAFLARIGFLNFAWIVTLAGIAFAVTISWKSFEWIHHNEQMRLENSAEEVIELIAKRLDANVQLLHSTAAFLRASEHVSHNTKGVHLPRDLSGTNAFLAFKF